MINSTAYQKSLLDPGLMAWSGNGCRMRSYQSDALRNIFDAAMNRRGGSFAVMFPRQSGKNETQAQLEAALMVANQHFGGNIIKIIPTEKNQGKVSMERLAGVLQNRGTAAGRGTSPAGACTPGNRSSIPEVQAR